MVTGPKFTSEVQTNPSGPVVVHDSTGTVAIVVTLMFVAGIFLMWRRLRYRNRKLVRTSTRARLNLQVNSTPEDPFELERKSA